ncbi:unnamed protein product [Lymnaea stagnalis]|uniref:Uncharacterized protein n=1 Tax=Lymnaea stagnalis TaxID=6523 RepID=A0AAV2GXQ6_LYMST
MTSSNISGMVIICSVLLSVANGQPPSGLPVSRAELLKEPEMIAALMYGLDWPEIRNRYLQGTDTYNQDVQGTNTYNNDGPGPLYPQDDLDYLRIDHNVGLGYKAQQSALEKGGFVLPGAYGKRGIYPPERLNYFKRSSLNELIRRLMALRGNYYTNGRASMMRFGAGRK